MPLFVPILRLLMLFLNVYDSYKTLKFPPPSTRNAGRPSVRALTQRKRDMKGCLAVWIVWASLSIYERSFENVVCLFIPFYEEFKSLILLFLILTRARGAEPIYLHLIRPLVKPYTRTLDASLDMSLMIGDFVLALSVYPIRLGLDWYHRKFGAVAVDNPSESEVSTDSSNDVNTSELPTSFLASSGIAHGITTSPSGIPVLPPSKSTTQRRRPSGDVPITTSESHRPSRDYETRRNTRDEVQLEPNFMTPRKEPLRRSSGSVSTKKNKSPAQNGSSEGSIDPYPPKPPKPDSTSPRYQIWYPPKASYDDDDDERNEQVDLTLRQEKPSVLSYEQQQYEEWRQYPPFPSAYPPTPLATTSRLMSATFAVSSSLYPPIEEETAQQDFPKSLLPPREPLNPSRAGDLSDNNNNFKFGTSLPSPVDVNDADDSMSNDDCEEEDEFNITLRTPLPPQGSLRSQIHPRRIVSIPSASSGVSVPSRLSALTTLTSVQTTTSSDSSLSPKISTNTASIIGKKRSHPRTRTSLTKSRVRQVEDEASSSDDDIDLQDVATALRTGGFSSSSVASPSEDNDNDDATASSASSSANKLRRGEEEEVPPEAKRRKVVRSPPRRGVTQRPRAKIPLQQHTAMAGQAQVEKSKSAIPVAAKRSSTRLRDGATMSVSKPGPSGKSLVKGASKSSSSALSADPPVVLPKPSKRVTSGKR